MSRLTSLSSSYRSLKTSTITLSLFAFGFFSTASSAMAHHAMDGNLPANWWEGFLSGLAHPIVGADHFAFVVAVGLLAAKSPKGNFFVIAFLGSAMAGTGIHLFSMDLPVVELVVSGSVILFGALLLFERNLHFAILAAIASIAGLFHGYAYGESIIGAETTPIVAYLIGFTLVQLGIAMLAQWGARSILPKLNINASWLMRSAGAVICLVGAYFFANGLASAIAA